jgi:ferredoxin
MRIALDAEACTGHGRCYALAPEVFIPDDEGHCVVIPAGEVPAEHEGQARRGVANCPELALRVEE